MSEWGAADRRRSGIGSGGNAPIGARTRGHYFAAPGGEGSRGDSLRKLPK